MPKSTVAQKRLSRRATERWKICLLAPRLWWPGQPVALLQESKVVVKSLRTHLTSQGHTVDVVNDLFVPEAPFTPETFAQAHAKFTEAVLRVYQAACGYDLIHNHGVALATLLCPHVNTPTLHTIYDVLEFESLCPHLNTHTLTFLSRAQEGTINLEGHGSVIYSSLQAGGPVHDTLPALHAVVLVGHLEAPQLQEALTALRNLGLRAHVLVDTGGPLPANVAGVTWISRAEPGVWPTVERAALLVDCRYAPYKFDWFVPEALAAGVPLVAPFGASAAEWLLEGVSGFYALGDWQAAIGAALRLPRSRVAAFTHELLSTDPMGPAYEAAYHGLFA